MNDTALRKLDSGLIMLVEPNYYWLVASWCSAKGSKTKANENSQTKKPSQTNAASILVQVNQVNIKFSVRSARRNEPTALQHLIP